MKKRTRGVGFYLLLILKLQQGAVPYRWDMLLSIRWRATDRLRVVEGGDPYRINHKLLTRMV